MSTTQYTIRAVPAKVDQALRKQAKKTGQSLNQVALKALQKGTGVTADATFDDLAWFVGSIPADPKRDTAMTWMDSLPKDIE